MSSVPFLDETQVGALLRMEDALPLMERALLSVSSDRVVQPVRTVVPVAPYGGYLGSMPAFLGEGFGDGAGLGVKLVSFYPSRAGGETPTHHAIIVLFRPQTGEPEAILDGRLITEMRTAAASAVATRALSREDSRVLAILGSGVQAGSHVEALRLVRSFEEVRVWSPDRERRERLAAARGATAVETAEAAVRGADVVTTVTSASQPVLRGAWLAPGVHINAVGACRPDQRELDEEVIRRARVFVDSEEAARIESGDVILHDATIAAEIGAVLAGSAAGRRDPGEITLFKSLGLAVEDLVTACWVYERAREAGLLTA